MKENVRNYIAKADLIRKKLSGYQIAISKLLSEVTDLYDENICDDATDFTTELQEAVHYIDWLYDRLGEAEHYLGDC